MVPVSLVAVREMIFPLATLLLTSLLPLMVSAAQSASHQFLVRSAVMKPTLFAPPSPSVCVARLLVPNRVSLASSSTAAAQGYVALPWAAVRPMVALTCRSMFRTLSP